jgi:hypothetical protein
LLENPFPLIPLPGRTDLFYPDLERNIAKTTPTALSLLGFSFPKNQLLSPYLRKKEGWKMLESKEIENVIFLIIDALGYHEFLKHSKLLKKIFLTNGTVLSSVFPTITSTCLVSFHLGKMPIQHGILGHKIYFSEIGNIVDTLSAKALFGNNIPLPSAGVRLKQWLWDDFLFDVNDELTHIQLIENHIANTGLSHFIHEQPISVGYASHVDCFAAAQRILEREEGKQTFLDIYIGSIDSISHRYTPESRVLADELLYLEQLLFTFFDRLPPAIAAKTAIMISADHGQETLSPEASIAIPHEEVEELHKLIDFRGRSGRVIHLYSQKGKHDEVIDWFAPRIEDKGVILTPKDYPKFMGKGADNPKVIERLGDIQIVLGEKASLFFGHDGNYDTEYDLDLNATHGSLTKNELLVPLIFGSIDHLVEEIKNE